MSLATPLTHLAELRSAESALERDLAGRDAAWSRQASALPGWTRAHVVAHLAGNATGMANLATWASSGTETPMYPSREVRADEIERRAALDWAELLADLTASVQALDDALQALTEPVEARLLRLGSGVPVEAAGLGAARIREVQIHRVDLASDFRASDWDDAFTLRTMGQLAPFFAKARDVPVHTLRCADTGHCWQVGRDGPDLLGTEAELLAWLIGRPHGTIDTTDKSSLPSAPAWV